RKLDEAQATSRESVAMQEQLSFVQRQLEEQHKLLGEAAENKKHHQSTQRELETCKNALGILKVELEAKTEELKRVNVLESETKERIAELEGNLGHLEAMNSSLRKDSQELKACKSDLKSRDDEVRAQLEQIEEVKTLELATNLRVAELQDCLKGLEAKN